jgi:hypothetical protein
MQWISVKERFPEHRQDVLIFYEGEFFLATYLVTPSKTTGRKHIKFHPEKREFYVNEDVGWDPLSDVTHWMPLPQPPHT